MSRILCSIKDGVALVSLNRPEVRNAFDPAMIAEITAAFNDFAADSSLCAVVLRGEGTSFCAGADLAWMKSMVDYTLAQNQEDSLRLFDMFDAIRNCPVPVICAVQGHAIGGALGLIATADVVAAEAATVFSFSEVKIGLVPAVISPFVLEKAQRLQVTRYMLTGEQFSAPQAKSADLVHVVGTDAEVAQFIDSTVQALKKNAPEAVRATKKLLRFVGNESNWASVRAETTRVIAERRVSAEGQEGLRSFLEKRTPNWKKS